MKIVVVSAGILALTISLSGCGAFPESQEAESSNPAETISEAKASIAAESSEAPSSSASTPSPSTARTDVPWAVYDPGAQSEIDQMTNAGDCQGITSYFGMATATEDSVKARTGHGNESLVQYIIESLQIAGCG